MIAIAAARLNVTFSRAGPQLNLGSVLCVYGRGAPSAGSASERPQQLYSTFCERVRPPIANPTAKLTGFRRRHFGGDNPAICHDFRMTNNSFE